MPSVFEECSCGAKIELRDAHYEQCKWLIKSWREAHKHEHSSDVDNGTHFAIDSSRNETPMGFTRGIRSTTGDPEPYEDDPEERRRR